MNRLLVPADDSFEILNLIWLNLKVSAAKLRRCFYDKSYDAHFLDDKSLTIVLVIWDQNICT